MVSSLRDSGVEAHRSQTRANTLQTVMKSCER